MTKPRRVLTRKARSSFWKFLSSDGIGVDYRHSKTKQVKTRYR